MDELSGLAAFDITLLPQAVACATAIKDIEDRVPTQDELKRALHCSSASAKRLQHFLSGKDITKIADKLAESHEKSTIKALVQTATDAPYLSGTEYLVKEVARLSRRESKDTFVKKAQSEIRAAEIRAEVEELKDLAKAELSAVARKKVTRPATDASGNMLEISLFDAHLGKLSWAKETGHESYDTEIAVAMYRRAQEMILARTAGIAIDKILLVVGNDLLNSDTAEGTTTKGTPVSTDGRYHRTFQKARNLIIECVEKARLVAPVHVLVMPGNHDRLATYHLGDSLECYYHGQPDVTVDNTPVARKYLQHGKVMLMFCHGDRGKRTDLPLVMASEQPKMWGATQFRECHTGHLHQTRTEEQCGVRVRIIPSLSPPDEWHASNGYVGNLRSAEGYIWNHNEGLISQVFYCDDAQSPIVTKRKVVKAA